MPALVQNRDKRNFCFVMADATPLEQTLVRYLDSLPRTAQARRLIALAAQGYLFEARLLRLVRPRPASSASVGAAPGFRFGGSTQAKAEVRRSTGNLPANAVAPTGTEEAKPFAFLRSVIGD